MRADLLIRDLPSSLLERLDRAGPRYTSYPTVPVWTPAFGEAQWSDALAHAGRGARGEPTVPLAMYAHFPYCAMKCLYCGCNALVTRNAARQDAYLDTLARELDLVTDALGAPRTLRQLHWGGGTPNHQTGDQLRRSIDLFRQRFDFTPDAELSIEADPRCVEPGQLELLASLGFTRISFGVQDLDPEVQEAIGRRQPEAMVRRVVDDARMAGFTEVNLDVMYGLPRQTRATLARTLDAVIAMAPDRVACFGYAHLPQARRHQGAIDERALPDSRQRLELFAQAVTAFTERGYVWVGLDHFAAPHDPLARAMRHGEVHRNFMGYMPGDTGDLVGVGVSAIGDAAGCYAQNDARLPDYTARVERGELPVVRGHRLREDDLVRRAAIMRLMCNGALPYGTFTGALEPALDVMAEWEADDLVEFAPDELRVTTLGRFFVRTLAFALDAYLPAQQVLYSKAV